MQAVFFHNSPGGTLSPLDTFPVPEKPETIPPSRPHKVNCPERAREGALGYSGRGRADAAWAEVLFRGKAAEQYHWGHLTQYLTGKEAAEMTGFVNSIQSLGAVDGPGVRYVVFMQGCPLRCVYCHNPDTWLTEGGTPTDADELVRRALRFRPYWKNGGGVTVTGGEPLLQADFVAEFFEKLHEHGVHTALDTSGVGNLAQAEKVLEHTDLVLCDLKFLSKADYLKNCRADYGQIERFLQLTAMKGVPLWIRHVVVPGLTDSLDHLRRVKAKAESYPNFEKLEFLPFHKLCIEKYDRLGLEFPLRDTPAMTNERLSELLAQL